MKQKAPKVSRILIHVVLLCTASLSLTVNAEDPAAAGAPATEAQETPAENTTGAWDKTKEVSHEAWEATKEGSAKAWDKTKEVTHETMEKISPSESADSQDRDGESAVPADPQDTR